MTEPHETDFDALRRLLLEPAIPRDFSPEILYRCAGFGALTILGDALESSENGDANTDVEDAALLLIETIQRSPSLTFRAQAFRILSRATADRTSNQASEAIIRLALEFEDKEALEIVRDRNLRAVDPEVDAALRLVLNQRERLQEDDPALNRLTGAFLKAQPSLQERLIHEASQTLPGWCATVLFLRDSDAAATRDALANAYPNFTTAEFALLFALIDSDAPFLRTLSADLFLRHDDERLAERCRERQARPSDPKQLAVYAYLLEDWSLYEANDLDYRAVRHAFDTGDKTLQNRLIATAVRTGMNDWLTTLDDDARTATDKTILGLADWHGRIRDAVAGQDAAQTWQLALIAPLCYGQTALPFLKEVRFLPDDFDAQHLYHDFVSYAQHNPNLPKIKELKRVHISAGSVPSLALSHDGKRILSSTPNGQILVLDRDHLSEPLLKFRVPNLSLRRLKFSPDGSQIISYWNDRTLRIFNAHTGAIVQTIRPGGEELINFWIRNDNRRLVTLSRDGEIVTRSFPTGVELQRDHPGAKGSTLIVFQGSYCDEKNRVVACSSAGEARVFDLTRRILLNRIDLGAPVTACTDELDEDRLYVGFAASSAIFHVTSGKRLAEFSRGDLPTTERTVAVLPWLNGDVTLTFCADGTACTNASRTGERLTYEKLPLLPVHAALDDAAHALILSDIDGRFYRYDMSDLSLALRPLADIRADEVLVSSDSEPIRALLRDRIDWVRRFDIDLDFGDSTTKNDHGDDDFDDGIIFAE